MCLRARSPRALLPWIDCSSADGCAALLTIQQAELALEEQEWGLQVGLSVQA
jgi:hypothetical protein